ncbi:MAG: hypothetical protein JWM36_4362 [Hyphomicrobiales bacterium]|nr:hypothetical protein [Hyphomicrobiales bacterium]
MSERVYTTAEQSIELDLTYLASSDFLERAGQMMKAGKLPIEEYQRRNRRLEALRAARDTLRDLALKEKGSTP